MCSKKDVYHNPGIDENNMGQMHSEMNVYQIQCCRNIGDYDFFYGNTQMLCAYCDVDQASNMDDCKSTSSYVFLLGNGVINLNSKKQNFVVMLSTKVKYMVTSQTTR